MAPTSQEESKDDASSPEAVTLPRQDKKFAPFNVFFSSSVTLSQKFKGKKNKLGGTKMKAHTNKCQFDSYVLCW